MSKLLSTMALVAIVSACGGNPHEVTAVSDNPRQSTTSQIRALSTKRVALPDELPPEGFALDVLHKGVRLVALDGRVIAAYPNATFHHDRYFGDTPEAGPLMIRNGSGRLRVGTVIPAHAAPTTASPYDDCEVADEAVRVALLLCGPPAPNVAVVAHSIELAVDGKRMLISGPAHPDDPKLGPVGRWASAELSPSGRHVLALWTGECEEPETFVISLDGKRMWTFPGDGTPMGWTSAGDALAVLLQPGCGEARVPGVYAMTPGQEPRLVVALPEPDPRQTNYGLVRWRHER